MKNYWAIIPFSILENTMTDELIIKSLTLNSIGLFVLGLGFLITHFWNRRKWSRDTDVIVIDVTRESFVSRLVKVKFLFLGAGFIAGAIIWGIQDYERSVMNRNGQILEETLTKVKSSKSLYAKRRAVRDMESIIPLSILEKQNEKSMEEWYDSKPSLYGDKSIKSPECVILYYLYEEIREFKNLEKLDRDYAEFYEDYWGRSRYKKKRDEIVEAYEADEESYNRAEEQQRKAEDLLRFIESQKNK